MTNVNVDGATRRRNRFMLLLILGLSFGALLVAGVLRFSGWRPSGHVNKGQMLQPYGDLRDFTPTLADGGAYRWHDSPRTWRMVVAPRDCDTTRRTQCARLLENLDKVWRIMGRHADRVHVLWIGAAPDGVASLREVHQLRPDPRLTAGLAGSDDPRGDPVWLVDPNGFVVLRYAPGADPGDWRSDLARLLKIN